MRHILHLRQPSNLALAHRAEPHPQNPREAWERFDSSELREHLWELQYGLCAYCERSLEVGPGLSSIEHIVPKSSNPSVTFKYENLVLCCLDQNTCNLHKKGHYFSGFHETGSWSEGFVDPTQPRCESCFIYQRNGEVTAAEGVHFEDTVRTIDILNFKHPDLETQRRNYLSAIEIAIVAMGEQLEAIEEYLREELAFGGMKPFFSAKKQNFNIEPPPIVIDSSY